MAKTKWFYFFFALAVFFTLWMDAVVAVNFLDGDTSEYMYRAYTMAQTNNLFTTACYRTTELRLFDAAIFFAPFFKIFSNWTLVRICGTVAAQGFYVLSFCYLLTQIGVSKAAKWTASALLLMPFSTPYARVVLYHLYYITFISFSFWLMGLLLRMENLTREDSSSAVWIFPDHDAFERFHFYF